MVVYLAKNKINGKMYVGYSSKGLDYRITIHKYKSKSRKLLFHKAIVKYGISNFEWTILFESDSLEETKNMESYFILELNTISPFGYNLTSGGNGGTPNYETIMKIKNSLKDYWKNNIEKHPWRNLDQYRRSEWAKKSWIKKKETGYKHIGKDHTEESKMKIRITKNEKNKLKWINIHTNEIVELSLTKMSEHTGMSISTFNHIKMGRQKVTKSGWMLLENNDLEYK